MDQVKIGKFIAECRKKQKLTQMQLAEKLGITDRAVSKWENGKTMPDSSLMLELCDILGININDLLHGERVSTEDYGKQLEDKLVEVVAEKERSDKLLMRLCYYLGTFDIITTIIIGILTANMEQWWTGCFLFGVGVLSVVSCIIMVRIPQVAGYYQCEKCGTTGTPATKDWICSYGWSEKRMKMKCHCCNKKTWHQKVYRK